MTAEEFILRQAGAERRRAEAQRAFLARFYWVKVRHPKYGRVDVEADASSRDEAVAKVSARYPDAEVIEVADRAHHTDYCDDPKYAAEHAAWLR